MLDYHSRHCPNQMSVPKDFSLRGWRAVPTPVSGCLSYTSQTAAHLPPVLCQGMCVVSRLQIAATQLTPSAKAHHQHAGTNNANRAMNVQQPALAASGAIVSLHTGSCIFQHHVHATPHGTMLNENSAITAMHDIGAPDTAPPAEGACCPCTHSRIAHRSPAWLLPAAGTAAFPFCSCWGSHQHAGHACSTSVAAAAHRGACSTTLQCRTAPTIRPAGTPAAPQVCI